MNNKYVLLRGFVTLALMSGVMAGCGGGGGGGTGAGGISQSAAEQAGQFILLDKYYFGSILKDTNVFVNDVLKVYTDRAEALMLKSDNTFKLSYFAFKEGEPSFVLPLSGKFEVYDVNKKIIKLNIDEKSKCFAGKTYYFHVNSDDKLTTIHDIPMEIDLLAAEFVSDEGMDTNCTLTTSLKAQPE